MIMTLAVILRALIITTQSNYLLGPVGFKLKLSVMEILVRSDTNYMGQWDTLEDLSTFRQNICIYNLHKLS